VLYVKELFEKFIKNTKQWQGMLAAGLCLLAVPVIMAARNGMTMTAAIKYHGKGSCNRLP
jgi:hypothetical protein